MEINLCNFTLSNGRYITSKNKEINIMTVTLIDSIMKMILTSTTNVKFLMG